MSKRYDKLMKLSAKQAANNEEEKKELNKKVLDK